MIGIIVVSHSVKLAEGVKDIICMMAPEVRVSIAGGHEDGSYGICRSLIRAAMREMRDVDHVLVFMDLGSSAIAVEDISGEFPRGKFEMMNCPLVEGAVNAAVMIAGDAPLKDVVRAAMESRNAFKF